MYGCGCLTLTSAQTEGSTISPEERSNYSSFNVAFLTTFQILTGEDWNAVMYSAMQSWPGQEYLGNMH